MGQRIRFHAYVSAADASTAQELILYAEGDDSTITLAAGDRIELDSASIETGTGTATLFFRATAGAADVESIVIHQLTTGRRFQDFPGAPRRGAASDKLFCINSGANATAAAATGWVFRA